MTAVIGQCAGAADIGSQIANFQLSDTSEKTHSLNAYSGNVVVLVFWSFKCPVSLAYIDRIEEIRSKYEGKKVVVLVWLQVQTKQRRKFGQTLPT